MLAGDLPQTFSDTRALEQATGFRPDTDLQTCIAKCAEWFLDYYAADAKQVDP